MLLLESLLDMAVLTDWWLWRTTHKVCDAKAFVLSGYDSGLVIMDSTQGKKPGKDKKDSKLVFLLADTQPKNTNMLLISS